MRITKVLDAVYEIKVGWSPSSGSIKPVHIANGLFRALSGKRFDISDVVKFAVPGRKGKEPDEDRTFEALVLHCNDPRFKEFARENKKDSFERIREAIRGLIDADKAVYPSASHSSLSLTCRQMISSDTNDRHVGEFMAALLRGPKPDDPNPLAALISKVLDGNGTSNKERVEKPQDPISFLVWPLLSEKPASYLPNNDKKCVVYTNGSLKTFIDNLNSAAKNLVEHEKEQSNRLATLQKSVQFVCLMLIAHAQALASDGKTERRIPLFLSMDAAKGSSLALASEISLNAFYAAFEDWLARQLAAMLKNGAKLYDKDPDKDPSEAPQTPKTLHRATVRAWLKKFTDKDGNEPNDKIIEIRLGFFEQALAQYGREDVYLVLGETLAKCSFEEYISGGPREFLQAVGKRIGLVYPYGQGRTRDKRIRPSVHILNLLVKACVPANKSIPFNEFLDRLWERFGIIAGGRIDTQHSDPELLAAIGADVSPSDLQENCAALIECLSEIGLARKYPDNISYVGKYNA